MTESSAQHPYRSVQRRGAILAAALLVLCFATARLVDAPMAADAALMATMRVAAHGVADEARSAISMGGMLCPDDGLGAQAAGVTQPVLAATWPAIAVVLVAATWLGRSLPARHARSPGPTRQALLQRFQL